MTDVFSHHRLLGYEGLEVTNPEGGTDDAEAEAQRGRWKQEVLLCLIAVTFLLMHFCLVISIDQLFNSMKLTFALITLSMMR